MKSVHIRSRLAVSLSASALALGAALVLAGTADPALATECLLDTNNDGVADAADTDGGATGTGTDSLACGPAANAAGTSSVASGDSANAGSDYSVAIGGDYNGTGTGANASNEGAIAIGADANTPGYYGVAVGSLADATNIYASAFGTDANATGAYTTAVGANAMPASPCPPPVALPLMRPMTAPRQRAQTRWPMANTPPRSAQA